MEEKPRLISASPESGSLFDADLIRQRALTLKSEDLCRPIDIDNAHGVCFFPFSGTCVVYSRNIDGLLLNKIIDPSKRAISGIKLPKTLIFNDYSQKVSENTSYAISSFGKTKHLCKFSAFLIEVNTILDNFCKRDYMYSNRQCYEAVASCISNLNIETSLTFTTENSTILYCLFHKKPHLDALLTKPLLSQFSSLTGISQDSIQLNTSNSIEDVASISKLLDSFLE